MPEPAVLTRLRPLAGREALAAAGAVLLAVAAYAIELRMTQWALGPKLLVAAVIAALALGMGWAAGPPGLGTRPYQSLLLISGLLVLVLALVFLGEVLAGHHRLGAGGVFWTLAVEAGVGVAAARRAGSAGCTLLAALFASISFLSFIAWVFHPHTFDTFRWILLLESVVLAAVAVRLGRAYRRHGVQLINVAGLLALFLGLTFLAAAAISGVRQFGTALSGASIGSAGAGLKLYLLVTAGALIAYAVRDREPAPGIIGAGVAITFAVLVGLPSLTGGSLVFWPLFLLILGGLGVAYSLIGPPTVPSALAPAPPPAPPMGTAPPPGPPPPTGTVPPPGPPPASASPDDHPTIPHDPAGPEGQ
jgi:hypothetical protein